MYKKPMSILLFLALGSSSAAWAAGAMKAGLWEMTTKSDAMKSMPKMSPQQLEQMRKMGMNMPQMQDGAMVSKICISKAMAEREQPVPHPQEKEAQCQSKNFQRSGSSYSVDIICDGPRLKGEGKAQGTYSGNDRYTSTYDFKGMSGDKPISHHQESTGKWLGADCGDVKPMDELMNAYKNKYKP